MALLSAARRSLFTSLLMAGVASSVSADVLVVDIALGAGSDYGQIQDAVTAAQEGDTILVREGAYQFFFVDGKSLTIVADGDVSVAGANIFYTMASMEVRNLAAHQDVVVRGIDANSGVGVLECDGSVWFDELFVSGDVPCSSGGTAGAFVRNSHLVTFTACQLRGESNTDPWHAPHPSAHGLWTETSTVQLYDTVIKGGWGQDSTHTPLVGGSGIRLEDSTVMIVGCLIQGGEGGLDQTSICEGSHAAGGPGVEFVGATATIRSAESIAEGGFADLTRTCPGEMGPQGPAISGAGTIVPLAGFARQLRANSPVRGGETVTFEVAGVEGEIPLIAVSLDHQPIYLPGQNGSLLIGLPPSDVFVLPALPAGGEATLAFAVPNVGVLTSALTFHAQAVFLDTTPKVWLGAGTTVVLLDASF